MVACCLSALLSLSTISSLAQAMAPEKSAKAAAMSDSRLISSNIQYNQDIMFFSQKAIDYTKDSRIKELADQMITEHSALLYAMEQLKTAGSSSSGGNAADGTDEAQKQSVELNTKLSQVSGVEFDSVWVAGMLIMEQTKHDELSIAKETTTNLRLKMGLTEAIPIIRKYRNQLRIVQKDLAKIAMQQRKEAAAALKKKK